MLGLRHQKIGKSFGGTILGEWGVQPSELKNPNLLDETFQPGLTWSIKMPPSPRMLTSGYEGVVRGMKVGMLDRDTDWRCCHTLCKLASAKLPDTKMIQCYRDWVNLKEKRNSTCKQTTSLTSCHEPNANLDYKFNSKKYFVSTVHLNKMSHGSSFDNPKIEVKPPSQTVCLQKFISKMGDIINVFQTDIKLNIDTRWHKNANWKRTLNMQHINKLPQWIYENVSKE